MISTRLQSALLLLVALTFSACNLTRNQPTPTPFPATATFVPLQLPSDLTPIGSPIPPNPNCATTPQGWIPYVIERGDSLGLLAQQTDSTIQDLVAGNCMDNADSLIEGTTIYVPKQPVIGQ